MHPYADYSYYVTSYRGKMPQCDFERLAGRASAYLNSVTFRRIRAGWAEDELVKEACCAIADVYFLEEHGGGVASETNDGISVTYVAGSRAAQTKTMDQRLWETAVTYLGSTGLLYQGVL